MKKDNRFLVAIVALILLGVSVGYAIISQTYKLNGTANIGANTWGLEKPGAGDITVDPPESPKPTITEDEDGNFVIEFAASLEKPGDYYEFVVPIKNTGSIAAVLAETPVLTVANDKDADINEYLKFTVVDADSETGAAFAEGYKLAAETGVANVKVRVEYRNDDAVDTTKYPDTAVNGVKLSTEFKFVQDTTA